MFVPHIEICRAFEAWSIFFSIRYAVGKRWRLEFVPIS
jgi:hypothetical protein